MIVAVFLLGGRNLNSFQVLFMEEFMMEVLNVVAIIVAGLMVGVNWPSPRLFIQRLISFRMMSICQPQAPWLACWGDSCRFGTFLYFCSL